MKQCLFSFYHPDKNPEHTSSTEYFKMLNTAYEKIKEDQMHSSGESATPDLNSLFNAYEQDYNKWKEEQELNQWKEKEKKKKAEKKSKTKAQLNNIIKYSAATGLIGFCTYGLYKNHLEQEAVTAIENGDIEKLEQLLSTHNINLALIWKTIIDINQVDVAKFLLSKNFAIFRIYIENNKTPLHYALETNRQEIATLICQDYKAKIAQKIISLTTNSALSEDAENMWKQAKVNEDLKEFIKQIVNAYCDNEAIDENNKDAIIKYIKYIDLSDAQKMLHKAIDKNDYELILALNTVINMSNSYKDIKSPELLNLMVINGTKLDSAKIYDLFLKAIKNINLSLMRYIAENYTLSDWKIVSWREDNPWQILIDISCELSENELIEMLQIFKSHIPVKIPYPMYNENCYTRVACNRHETYETYCARCSSRIDPEKTKNRKILIRALNELSNTTKTL